LVRDIKIGSKIIGENKPTFIIAEAGVNHNGDIRKAKKLVDAAKKAGADAVKFQTFKAENLVTETADMADYQIKNIGKKETQLQMLKKLELSHEDFHELKKYCDKKKIIFLSTPHSYDAIDFLEKIVPAYKFGSGDLTNIPSLTYTAKKGKPMILGTGMATIEEVKQAVNTIKQKGNNQIIALHCTTNYPTPFEETNLNAIKTMKEKLDCIIGYSDHTLGTIASIIAVSIGAKVIEKHFTLDKKLPGPDHKASLDPEELTEMIKEIRNTEKILGKSDKKPTEKEKQIMKLVRKSVVAKEDIKRGTRIRESMLIIKRPGTGIPPYKTDKIIGKKAKKDIKQDEILKFDMVE
jgi:N-acetylneuraminate synthase/N,N'-diacetyllegionaminate synthase